MAFTYSLDSDVGRVRLIIGDTAEESAFFEDDEIEYFLTSEGSVKLAAARACDALAARASASDDAVSEKIGDYSRDGSGRIKGWTDLAARLRSEVRKAPALAVARFKDAGHVFR